MKKLFYYFFYTLCFVITLTTIVSCENKHSDEVVDVEYQKVDSLMHIVDSTDRAITDFTQQALSLRYENDDKDNIIAYIHIDSNAVAHKLTEVYFNKKENYSTETDFFLDKKGATFAVKQKKMIQKNPETFEEIETINFYDKNKNITHSIQRKGNQEKNVSENRYAFLNVPEKIDLNRVWDVINQKNDFETTFQGFIKSDLDYIVVGKENGYTTALRIEYYDPLIQQLTQNPKKYLNDPVIINFNVETEPNGFQYQTYQGGKWR